MTKGITYWTSSPPQPGCPHIRVVGHVSEHSLERGDALRVGTAGCLADNGLLVVRFQPGRRGLELLFSNRSGYACGRRARSIGV